MELKERLFRELVKKGYSQLSDGRKVWDVANRSFMYVTKELAEAFLNARAHPRYKEVVIDIEMRLLRENSKMFDGLDEPFNLIDMGCGDGGKAKVFLELLDGKGRLRFCPVNVNQELVDLALRNVKELNFKNIGEYKPHIACLDNLHEVASIMRNGEYQRNVILLLGSILASFEIHEYLFNLSQAMFKGDLLIIGNGIRTGERFVNIETYKHQLFRDWLGHIIRALGFNDDEVEFDARFANGRVEGFYKVKSRITFL